MKPPANAASLLARLLARARQQGEDYSLLLNRFGLERLLDRLARSPHADRFLLKDSLAVHALVRHAAPGHARCRTQIDVGFCDAVPPSPVEACFPVMLADLPAPRLRTYLVYTVIAEKLHAIVLLGITSSWMKDYLDLSVQLALRRAFNVGQSYWRNHAAALEGREVDSKPRLD